MRVLLGYPVHGFLLIVIGLVFIANSVCSSKEGNNYVWKVINKKVPQSQIPTVADPYMRRSLKTKSEHGNKGKRSSIKNSVVAVPAVGLGQHAASSRQYGYDGYAHYGGGGGYDDKYTLIAVTAFAALFGALFFELLGGGTLRSLSSSSLNLPFRLDTENIPELMSKISDWVVNSSWFKSKARAARAVAEESSELSKVFKAYRKDPVEFQCIRKLACEALANSPAAARSMKSRLGGIALTAIGSFMGDNKELLNLVEDTVGNPEICNRMVPWGFCE